MTTGTVNQVAVRNMRKTCDFDNRRAHIKLEQQRSEKSYLRVTTANGSPSFKGQRSHRQPTNFSSVDVFSGQAERHNRSDIGTDHGTIQAERIKPFQKQPSQLLRPLPTKLLFRRLLYNVLNSILTQRSFSLNFHSPTYRKKCLMVDPCLCFEVEPVWRLNS